MGPFAINIVFIPIEEKNQIQKLGAVLFHLDMKNYHGASLPGKVCPADVQSEEAGAEKPPHPVLMSSLHPLNLDQSKTLHVP